MIGIKTSGNHFRPHWQSYVKALNQFFDENIVLFVDVVDSQFVDNSQVEYFEGAFQHPTVAFCHSLLAL